VRDWFAYIPFRIAAAIFGALPESTVRYLGVRAGTLASKYADKKRPLLTSHMRRVIGSDASDSEIHDAVDGMYRSYGRYWAETFWFRPKHKKLVIENVERVNFGPVHEAIAARRGIVFDQKITEWFIDVRAQFGIDIVLTSDPARRSKMIRRLKEGGALALLADRDVTGKGIAVEFFGEETTVPAGPAALAELTDSVLLPVVVFFKKESGYRIEVGDPIEVPDAPTRAERVKLGAQSVADAMAAQIRKQPSQWHLFQPNWPSDQDFEPPGEST
jgi:KDO2-lipid IV(A) lauroyltransferase